MTGAHLKQNASTPKCGNLCRDEDWYVWFVDGFGVEESDARAAEAIEAGEMVTIITAPRTGNSPNQDAESDLSEGEEVRNDE